MKNYIFDLDGTLIDSQQEIISCIKEAAEGLINDLTIFNNVEIGKPIKKILEVAINDENIINEIIKKYRMIYDNKINDSSTLFEGTKNALEYLKNKGESIYLLTNKPYKPTNRVLTQFCIKQYFDDIYSIDSFEDKNLNKAERLKNIIKIHNLKPTETIYIGDTLEDVEAAYKNNILSVAAIWGYEKNKEKLISKADFWLSTLNFEQIDILTDKLLGLCY